LDDGDVATLALKEQNLDREIDSAEDAKDMMEEAVQDMHELSELLARPSGDEIDSDELLRELEGFDAAELLETEAKALGVALTREPQPEAEQQPPRLEPRRAVEAEAELEEDGPGTPVEAPPAEERVAAAA
jgi:hypothetical protein